MDNHREHERALVRWRARIVLPDGQQLDARTVDISEGGVGLLAPQGIGQVGQAELWLAVPEDENLKQYRAVRLHTRVVYQVLAGEGARIGLQFVELPADVRRLFGEWVQRARLRASRPIGAS